MQDHLIALGRPDGNGPGSILTIPAGTFWPPERFIVNAWRDEDDDGALHVSVHAPEPVLLSVGDDDVTLTPGNPYLVGKVTVHNTDDTPTVICVPGEPIHVFGHVRIITSSHEAADYLAADAEDAQETNTWFCDHCGDYFPVTTLTCACGAIVRENDDVATMADGHRWTPPGATRCEACHSGKGI